MTDVKDLITDIGSIVSSVRPGEIMTLKRVEDDYKAIFARPIPFQKFGYNSISKLIEDFPNHFKLYMTNGIYTIRSNARNNITELISKERKSKKPKNFQINQPKNNNNSNRYVRNNLPVKPQLPDKILNDIAKIVETFVDGFHKDKLLLRFKQYKGYEFNYRDFGFPNERELLSYLNGRVFTLQDDVAKPLPPKGLSLFDLLRFLLSLKTGFTLASLQQHVSENTSTNVPTLIKGAGRFSFDEVIQDAKVRGVLCFDWNLVYGASNRVSSPCPGYPSGVNDIRVVNVTSPSQFTFEIVTKVLLLPLKQLHMTMQLLAAKEPLLTMFTVNRFCSLKYQDAWYRAVIEEVHCELTRQRVIARFVDFPYELDRGVEVTLPTDRLRFVPVECETLPAFVHRGSLAYICALDGRQWSRQSCDIFASLASDKSSTYRSFVVDGNKDGGPLSVDVVVRSSSGETQSLFQRLVEMGLAQSVM